jgi:sulfur-oxidizing protein SoxY
MNRFNRRLFLRAASAFGVLCLGAVGGLLPRSARAAWPQAGFDARDIKQLMSALFQDASAAPSSDVRVLTPEIAENGAVVPITIKTTLPKVESVTLIAEGNPRPLAAVFRPAAGASSDIGIRLKLAKTQTITAVVKSDGKLYKGSKNITVSIGGCGG